METFFHFLQTDSEFHVLLLALLHKTPMVTAPINTNTIPEGTADTSDIPIPIPRRIFVEISAAIPI